MDAETKALLVAFSQGLSEETKKKLVGAWLQIRLEAMEEEENE